MPFSFCKDFKPSSFNIRSKNDDSSARSTFELAFDREKLSSSFPTQPCKIANSVLIRSVVLCHAKIASQLFLNVSEPARGCDVASSRCVGYRFSTFSIFCTISWTCSTAGFPTSVSPLISNAMISSSNGAIPPLPDSIILRWIATVRPHCRARTPSQISLLRMSFVFWSSVPINLCFSCLTTSPLSTEASIECHSSRSLFSGICSSSNDGCVSSVPKNNCVSAS